MSLHDLIQLVGPYAAIIFVVITSLLAILKVVVPKAFDAMVTRLQSREAERIRDREHERALESEKREEEQREQMALWTQMVELQTRVISQNEILLTWVTEKVGDDLKSFAQETQDRCSEAKVWWEKAARSMMQNQSQIQLMQMELSRMADSVQSTAVAIQSQEERIVSLVSFGLSSEEHRRRD